MTGNERWRSRELTWVDQVIGLGLAVGFVAVLMATMGLGYVRDEGFYFRAGEEYAGWFKELAEHVETGEVGESFTQASVDKHFAYNREHPPLPKALFGLSHWIFYEELGWMSPAVAMRFPAALFAGLLIYLIYLFGAEAFGRWEGAVAAVAMALMPRPFFHAHLSCFDYPVTAMWFAVSWAWWKSLRGSRWVPMVGLFFGLGLSIKHNVFFMPAVLGLHWLAVQWRGFRIARAPGGARLTLPPLPLALLSLAVLGPLVWYALWPWHWFDTFNRMAWYFRFHLEHVHYFQYYFGQNLYAPPFPVEFPFVMSAVTMPELVLVAMVGGATVLGLQWLRASPPEQGVDVLGGVRRWLRPWLGAPLPRDPRGTGWWLWLGALVPTAVIALPSTPIFGGIKHWMPAMPFVAIVAAVAIVEAGRGLARLLPRILPGGRRQAWAEAVCVGLFAALVTIPAVTACVHAHGYNLAFYNTFIGGTRGAADHKMMRQFWGYSSVHTLDYLNAEVGTGRPVFFQNTNGDSYQMYKKMGQLRGDIVYGPRATSDFGLLDHQMAAESLDELPMWQAYGTFNPVFVADYDGVPVQSVYRNRRALTPQPPLP